MEWHKQNSCNMLAIGRQDAFAITIRERLHLPWTASLRLLYSDPLAGVLANPARLDRIRQTPSATRRYVILFTPRSGSSRLTDILHQSGLSEPGECFNPRFLPRMAGFFGAATLPDYVDALLRVRNRNGLFGCELTYLHLLQTFKTPARFRNLLGPTDWVWLIRKDIVAQAVSASRMVQTGLAHDLGEDPSAVGRAEAAFVYDPIAIGRQLVALRWLEWRSEAMFARECLSPLRLSYEGLAELPPKQIAQGMAQSLGVSQASLPLIVQRHRRLGTDKNLAFAARFRQSHRTLIRLIERARQPMLDRLITPQFR